MWFIVCWPIPRRSYFFFFFSIWFVFRYTLSCTKVDAVGSTHQETEKKSIRMNEGWLNMKFHINWLSCPCLCTNTGIKKWNRKKHKHNSITTSIIMPQRMKWLHYATWKNCSSLVHLGNLFEKWNPLIFGQQCEPVSACMPMHWRMLSHIISRDCCGSFSPATWSALIHAIRHKSIASENIKL